MNAVNARNYCSARRSLPEKDAASAVREARIQDHAARIEALGLACGGHAVEPGEDPARPVLPPARAEV